MSPELMDILQRSLDDIECHLRSDLVPQELADAAGFSLSHYYHLFEAATGLSLGRYVTQRRLLHAVWAMHSGADVTTAALEYGFDTHAGFYKAFRKEFGCAPSRYLRSHGAAAPSRVNLKETNKMIDIKTARHALSAWNLTDANVTPAYYANSGHRSDNTFVVNGDYYLKCSQSLGEMQRQAALQRTLHRHGLAPRIIPTNLGQDVLRMEDTDFLLMQRLPGEPVQAMQFLCNPDQARALGEGLARLHIALRGCDETLCTHEDYAATITGWAIPAACAALGEEGAWLQDFRTRVERLFPALPQQIIHRDPNPDNILMNDGKVTGFLDFTLSRIMPKLFDLCYAATGILSITFDAATPDQLALFPAMIRAMQEGYNAVLPLTDEERSAVSDMILAIELTCVAAFAGSDKYARQYAVNKKMLQYLLQHIREF